MEKLKCVVCIEDKDNSLVISTPLVLEKGNNIKGELRCPECSKRYWIGG